MNSTRQRQLKVEIPTGVYHRMNRRAESKSTGTEGASVKVCAFQKQESAVDDTSTNSRIGRWQKYIRSSWKSLEDERVSSTSGGAGDW